MTCTVQRVYRGDMVNITVYLPDGLKFWEVTQHKFWNETRVERPDNCEELIWLPDVIDLR